MGITCWVRKVRNDGKLELSCRPPVDLSGFEGLSADDWLSGTVVGVDGGGLYVVVRPPGGGEMQRGRVFREDMVRDMFPTEGEDVRVRVAHVDPDAGLLELSMLEKRIGPR